MADASEDVVLSLNLSGLDGDLLTKVKKIVKDELKPIQAENKKLKKQVETQKKEIDALKKAKPAKAKKEIANMTEIKKQYEKFKNDFGKIETRVKAVEGQIKQVTPAKIIPSKTVETTGKVKALSPEEEKLEMQKIKLQATLDTIRDYMKPDKDPWKNAKKMSAKEEALLVRKYIPKYNELEQLYVESSQQLAKLTGEKVYTARTLKAELRKMSIRKATKRRTKHRERVAKKFRERIASDKEIPEAISDEERQRRMALIAKHNPKALKDMERIRKEAEDAEESEKIIQSRIQRKFKSAYAKADKTEKQIEDLIRVEEKDRINAIKSEQQEFAQLGKTYVAGTKESAVEAARREKAIRKRTEAFAQRERDANLAFTQWGRTYVANVKEDEKAIARRAKALEKKEKALERKRRAEMMAEQRKQKFAQQHASMLESMERGFSRGELQRRKSLIRAGRGGMMLASGALSGREMFSVGGLARIAASQVDPSTVRGATVLGGLLSIPVILELSKRIFNMLKSKGYPLNLDWRREIETEVNGLMDIEDKKKRLLGIDQYIVTQVDDYQPASGAEVYNSFLNRDEANIAKRGPAEKAFGIDY